MAVETPRASRTATQGAYTDEEKQSILENLHIEVADKKRRFEDFLERKLKSFLLLQESEVTRIPRAIRGITMLEFGTKYNGDIKYCLETMAREKLEESGTIELDAQARKRKRQEYAQDGADVENTKPPKSARKVPPAPHSVRKPQPSPSKGMGTPSRMLHKSGKTPGGTIRVNGPLRDLFGPNGATPLRPSVSQPLPKSTVRPPTTTHFNPLLPPTPAYPRKMRRNESLVSANGSPLANPYDFLGEDISDTSLEAPLSLYDRLHAPTTGGAKPAGRNSILLRREPSLSTSTVAKIAPSALLSVPTKDGHIIEFDPLKASPHELDDLEGITNSAKKKAKEDMVKLVQETLSKWKL